jgi:uncharacterized membrane protein
MAIGQISEALFLLIPVFFVRYGFKKTILVGMLAGNSLRFVRLWKWW